ncbi:hypothetical protein [Paracoccus pacificus]|uniref:CVNH domain-containing protein n=1 Tax=Paracoccus pacificus TaxID=1463598 RepID=A0ABW4RB12_9RHOB
MTPKTLPLLGLPLLLLACVDAAPTPAPTPAQPPGQPASPLGLAGSYNLDPAACANPGTGEGRLIIAGRSLQFYESQCTTASSTAVNGGGTALTLNCQGEGETWSRQVVLTPNAIGLTLAEAGRPTFTYRRCS